MQFVAAVPNTRLFGFPCLRCAFLGETNRSERERAKRSTATHGASKPSAIDDADAGVGADGSGEGR